MTNHLKTCKVIFLYIFLMVASDVLASKGSERPKRLSIAKRNFLTRERDYLKVKPISDDLKSFIKRFKRKIPGFPLKNKREDDLKEHMFVVKNGNIEPLENMSDVTANVPSSDPSGLGNFTVIPLIIPITVKTFTNATFCDNTTEYSDDTSTESARSFDKRTEQEIETEKPVKLETVEKIEVTQEKTEQPSPLPTAKAVITENISSTEVVVDDSVSTKSENMKFLNKVLSDVQELISYEKEGKPSGNNEGALCTVIGDWDSKIGGMQLQITTRNESLQTPTVVLAHQQPEADEGFLKNKKWNFTALVPFNHSSLMVLTAISDKSVATFIGDCRICEGSEAITGDWMLARRSANCKDRQEAHSFFSDVMRKNNIRKLQKEHLIELSTKNLATTTEL